MTLACFVRIIIFGVCHSHSEAQHRTFQKRNKVDQDGEDGVAVGQWEVDEDGVEVNSLVEENSLRFPTFMANLKIEQWLILRYL